MDYNKKAKELAELKNRISEGAFSKELSVAVLQGFDEVELRMALYLANAIRRGR